MSRRDQSIDRLIASINGQAQRTDVLGERVNRIVLVSTTQLQRQLQSQGLLRLVTNANGRMHPAQCACVVCQPAPAAPRVVVLPKLTWWRRLYQRIFRGALPSASITR